MRRFFSDQILETVLILVCVTGFLLVPTNLVSLFIWPLSIGILLLLMYALQQTKPHPFFEEKFGALMGGTMFTILGLILLFNKSAYLLGMGVGLGVAMLVGIFWTVLKTRNHQA